MQQSNYKNNDNSMKDENIKKDYELFLKEYKNYLLTDKEIWYNNLNKVKLYINNNKKRPSQHNKDKEIKFLGRWLSQQKKYACMKDENIKKDYEIFLKEYKDYLNNE